MKNRKVVVVVGGAVAGSEAIAKLTEKEIDVICIDQNPLPYGKIEDGLPRWHVEQRKKEYEKIDQKLSHPLVQFIPSTKIGRDLMFDEIYKQWGASALFFASGAWKDRPLQIAGVDEYVGKGLVYQNPLVYWFNHDHEPGFKGERHEIPDGAIVIGGGLASLDVMKICQIELTRKALKRKGIDIEMLPLEKEGIPRTLENHQLKWEDLGIQGATLYYRRRVEDMPLADAPEEATEEQRSKIGALRRKILTNYSTKFHFTTHDLHLPTTAIVEKGRLVGLTFLRTELVNGSPKPIAGSGYDVRAPLVISSIGSIPESIPGIPWKGERYEVVSEESGEIKGMPGAYLLGNAVTGKGNIRVSLLHGRAVAQHVVTTWLSSDTHDVSADRWETIQTRVRALQAKAGYSGNYKEWVDKHLNLRMNPA